MLLLGGGTVEALVRDTISQQLVAAEAWPGISETAELRKILNESKVLNHYFSKVDVLSAFPVSTLVPTALFDSEDQQKYLELEYGAQDAVRTIAENVFCVDSRNVFGIRDDIRDVLIMKYPNSRIRHATSMLLEVAFKTLRHKPGEHMVIQNFKDHLEAIVIKDGKMLLQNHFPYNGEEELLYYVMNLVEQLQLDPAYVGTSFMGEHCDSDSFRKLAKNYLGKVSFNFMAHHEKMAPALSKYNEGAAPLLIQSFACV